MYDAQPEAQAAGATCGNAAVKEADKPDAETGLDQVRHALPRPNTTKPAPKKQPNPNETRTCYTCGRKGARGEGP